MIKISATWIVLIIDCLDYVFYPASFSSYSECSLLGSVIWVILLRLNLGELRLNEGSTLFHLPSPLTLTDYVSCGKHFRLYYNFEDLMVTSKPGSKGYVEINSSRSGSMSSLLPTVCPFRPSASFPLPCFPPDSFTVTFPFTGPRAVFCP